MMTLLNRVSKSMEFVFIEKGLAVLYVDLVKCCQKKKEPFRVIIIIRVIIRLIIISDLFIVVQQTQRDFA